MSDETKIRRYKVTDKHEHDTLNVGDVVVMLLSPEKSTTILLRESDMTLHKFRDYCEQYVHLEEIP
jgi:hypothetical protein